MALYIGVLTGDFMRGAVTIVLILVFSYFSHRASHHIFPYNLFHKVHHDDNNNSNDLNVSLGLWPTGVLELGLIHFVPKIIPS